MTNPHAADLFAAIKTPEDLSAVLRRTMRKTMYMAAKAADRCASDPLALLAPADTAMEAFAEALRETADKTWGTAE